MTLELDDVGFTTYAPAVVVEPGGCDTCGARAYLYAIVNDVELKYCGHHGSRYFDRLMQAGRIVLDLRYSVLQ